MCAHQYAHPLPIKDVDFQNLHIPVGQEGGRGDENVGFRGIAELTQLIQAHLSEGVTGFVKLVNGGKGIVVFRRVELVRRRQVEPVDSQP